MDVNAVDKNKSTALTHWKRHPDVAKVLRERRGRECCDKVENDGTSHGSCGRL